MNNNKWADMHVSRETYDNTLRSGVNSYYEHAMNDPATSQEQAISETAQVSEGYLNAMDEFDAAQANVSNETDTGIDSGTSTDIGEGVSSGAETGTDAGADIGTDGGADNGSGIE